MVEIFKRLAGKNVIFKGNFHGNALERMAFEEALSSIVEDDDLVQMSDDGSVELLRSTSYSNVDIQNYFD